MAIKIKVITKKLFKKHEKNTLTNKKLITPKEKYFNNKNCKKINKIYGPDEYKINTPYLS